MIPKSFHEAHFFHDLFGLGRHLVPMITVMTRVTPNPLRYPASRSRARICREDPGFREYLVHPDPPADLPASPDPPAKTGEPVRQAWHARRLQVTVTPGAQVTYLATCHRALKARSPGHATYRADH
jgi:hypothetical protein